MNKLQYKKYNQLERRLDKMFQSYFINKDMLIWNYAQKHKMLEYDASQYFTDNLLSVRINSILDCRKCIVDIVKEMCELADIEFEMSYVLDVINEYKNKSEFDRYRRYGL